MTQARSKSNEKNPRIPTELNPRNLRQLCWLRGFHGVTGLAHHLGRSRVVIHLAVKRPELYGPTFDLIKKTLKV